MQPLLLKMRDDPHLMSCSLSFPVDLETDQMTFLSPKRLYNLLLKYLQNFATNDLPLRFVF